ncbi:MAG TPA: hypothetical protein DCY94_01870, partial [Firmicutes bacterium]|nr:hypothetical protein [Bacillota bacterium]
MPFERLNLNEILRKGNRAFRRGDYEECIDTYRIVLDHCKPKVFVYAKLGLAHLKLDHKELAIDYLSIATELNNMGDYVLEYDYSNLVLKLQGKIEEADAKTFVSMTEKDFNRNLDECFGIKQIERIVRAISLGADPEVACREFGLNSEKTATALLVIARNCYVQGNQELGDLYMKKVERMKDKPSNVIYLFNSIRKNRKFYKNRSNESN